MFRKKRDRIKNKAEPSSSGQQAQNEVQTSTEKSKRSIESSFEDHTKVNGSQYH